MKISKQNAQAIADLLSLLMDYIRSDEKGSPAIMRHAANLKALIELRLWEE